MNTLFERATDLEQPDMFVRGRHQRGEVVNWREGADHPVYNIYQHLYMYTILLDSGDNIVIGMGIDEDFTVSRCEDSDNWYWTVYVYVYSDLDGIYKDDEFLVDGALPRTKDMLNATIYDIGNNPLFKIPLDMVENMSAKLWNHKDEE